MTEGWKPDTEELLQQAAQGDAQAVDDLLTRHRQRLRRMVEIRMDSRVAVRVDPSDIVQEALVDASHKLPEYLRDRPIPFYPWLRQLAWERVIQQHRRHIQAQARTVSREQQPPLPDHSAMQLASFLVARGSSPSRQMAKKELSQQVQDVLSKLSSKSREVLVLRFLEQLSTAETAAVLKLTAEGVKSRQRRALEQFSLMFQAESGGGPP